MKFNVGDILTCTISALFKTYNYNFTIGKTYTVTRHLYLLTIADDSGKFLFLDTLPLAVVNSFILLPTIPSLLDHHTITNASGSCQYHEWEQYTGLRESFLHCKKCGIKQTDLPNTIKDEEPFFGLNRSLPYTLPTVSSTVSAFKFKLGTLVWFVQTCEHVMIKSLPAPGTLDYIVTSKNLIDFIAHENHLQEIP